MPDAATGHAERNQESPQVQLRALLAATFIASYLSLLLVAYVLAAPSWIQLFDALGYNVTLPRPTRFTIWFASFVRANWWWLLVLVTLLAAISWRGYFDGIAKGLLVMIGVLIVVLVVGSAVGMELAIADLARRLAPPLGK